MTLFTVLGATGFIGSHIVKELQRRGLECYCPKKGEPLRPYNLGHVVYCIGLTADFRTKPFETVEAHVCYLTKVISGCSFDSFMYLSSTRVYGSGGIIASERDPIIVEPLKFDDLYNISKVMGESVCFAQKSDKVRVVRLSNVYGYDEKSENFVFTLIRDALSKKKIVLNSTLDSCKDHISVKDVAGLLPQIALHGRQRIYNIASGVNTTAGQITDRIKEITGCDVEVAENAQRICFPRIQTSLICSEFGFEPRSILDDLEALIEEYKRHGGA